MRLLHHQVLRILHTLIFCFAFTIFASGQDVLDIKVHSGFLSDSLKIGDETAFYLAAKYPSSLNILFPDSAYNFAPFEYQRKRYFATETKNGISSDSTLYYLTTFELDSIQRLSMPVYVVNARDCTVYNSSEDSILLIQLVKNLPDTVSVQNLPLKANTGYHKVAFQFNYVIALIAGAALIIICAVVWIIFGTRILNNLRAKRLLKKHRDFINGYNRLIDQLQKAFSSALTESAVSHWKKYMEQLEARPYTKLTTRETLMLQQDEKLGSNLHNIDMAIYGGGSRVVESLEYLRTVADRHFEKKLEEVKHGK
jgi:hypothetical protein